MQTRYRRSTVAAAICVVVLAIAMIVQFYFQYISQQIYEECAGHLVEVYSQVNYNFISFLEKNWANLDDWAHHIQIEDDEHVLSFLQARRQNWKFSQFYFLSEDGSCITPEGEEEYFAMEQDNSHDALFQRQERVMFSETLSDRQAVTLFAIPVSKGTYRGFDYTAIAISYTNAGVVDSLYVDAFSGQSMCLVSYTDGRVLLSTQEGGSVFGNYLSYLKAGSSLDQEALDKIRQDWENGVSGVSRCEIGGVAYYISYQPVGYEDCILVGVVPEAEASASLLKIQRATIDMLVKVAALLGLMIFAWVVYTYRQKTKKSTLELRYRELMFDMLSNNVDDIFLMLDSATWEVDYLSPNIERLLGVSAAEVREDVHLLERGIAGGSGPVSRRELDDIPADGSFRWEQERVHQTTGERRWYSETVYRASIEGVEKIIVVMSDRTHERNMSRNMEEALAAAKSANEAKSQFLSNMSHDIRTPMNAIIGFSVLLDRDAGNEEKVREYTRKISAASQHLLGLINDVLDMSKIESGKTSLHMAVFSLPELMEELHTLLLPQARAKGQTFEFCTKGRPAQRLSGDKLRLNQILINLLSNAIKYTQEGGEIRFTVEELPHTSPQFSRLRFIVADNGIGMSEEFVKNIFEPFSREANSTTSKIQGTGLGMAITKNLVELMGGVIRVTSKQGEGSVFTVELSFALPEQTAGESVRTREEALPDGAAPTLEGLLFLVAEDNELNAEILSEMMSMEGAQCELAVNGQEAVEMFRRSEPGHYDMVLMDIQMPVMNGYEAARQIRACGHPMAKSIPIVAMTANAFAEDVRSALDAGMDGHLSKPIDMDAVRALLGSLRRRGQSGPREDGEGDGKA